MLRLSRNNFTILNCTVLYASVKQHPDYSTDTSPICFNERRIKNQVLYATRIYYSKKSLRILCFIFIGDRQTFYNMIATIKYTIKSRKLNIYSIIKSYRSPFHSR